MTLRILLAAAAVVVALTWASAPRAQQDAPRNFWDLREPAHTEEHAQSIAPEQPTAPSPAEAPAEPAAPQSSAPATPAAPAPTTQAPAAPGAPEAGSATPVTPAEATPGPAAPQAPAVATPAAPQPPASPAPETGATQGTTTAPAGAPAAPASEGPETPAAAGSATAPAPEAPAPAPPGTPAPAAPAAGTTASEPPQEGAEAESEEEATPVRSLDALYRLGRAAQQRGDVREAERRYKAVLERAPYHFLTHLALGRLYLHLDPAAAREHLETARRLHPSSEDVHYLLGQAYEALGRDLDAADAYRYAIYLNPRHYDANARLRKVLRRMRAGRSVVERAAESFYQHPNLATLTLFGRIVMENGTPREALLEFEEVRRREPGLAEVELWLARAHHALEDAPGEIAAYRRYLRQRPDATGVRLTLVERLVARGWYQDAVATLAPLDGGGHGVTDGVAPATRSRVTFLRSRLLSAQGEPGRAGEMLLLAFQQGYAADAVGPAYQEDLALYPDAPALWFAYGNWLRAVERPADAADALAHAGRLDATERRKARALLRLMRDRGVAPVATSLALGELAWADGQGDEALAQLAGVPAGHPLDARAALLRGKIYRAHNDLEAALDQFTRYVFSYEDRRDAIYARGNLFWELGRRQEALAVWMEHPDVLLRHPAVLGKVADYDRSTGDVKAEIAMRERLAQAVPANLASQIRLGELYEQQGRHLEAVLLWDRVAKARPRDAELLARVGAGWLSLGDAGRAVPLLQRASQLQALDAPTTALLARELYRTHQYEEALRVYWSLYQQEPTHPDLPRVLPELVLNLPATPEQRAAAAKLAQDAGRLKQAAEVLEALLGDAPKRTEARLALAEVYLRQDKAAQAEAVLMAPDAAPGADEHGLELLAEVQGRLGRKAALAETLGRLQQLRPDDAALGRRRGLLLADLHRNQEALPLLERALADAPRDDAVTLALADVQAALGHTAQAESLLRLALARAPANNDARRRLIDVLLKAGRWEAVTEPLEAWLADHPRDATARYNLVTAYLKRFDTAAARPHYEALLRIAPRRARSLAAYFR